MITIAVSPNEIDFANQMYYRVVLPNTTTVTVTLTVGGESTVYYEKPNSLGVLELFIAERLKPYAKPQFANFGMGILLNTSNANNNLISYTIAFAQAGSTTVSHSAKMLMAELDYEKYVGNTFLNNNVTVLTFQPATKKIVAGQRDFLSILCKANTNVDLLLTVGENTTSHTLNLLAGINIIEPTILTNAEKFSIAFASETTFSQKYERQKSLLTPSIFYFESSLGSFESFALLGQKTQNIETRAELYRKNKAYQYNSAEGEYGIVQGDVAKKMSQETGFLDLAMMDYIAKECSPNRGAWLLSSENYLLPVMIDSKSINYKTNGLTAESQKIDFRFL